MSSFTFGSIGTGNLGQLSISNIVCTYWSVGFRISESVIQTICN